MSDQITASIQEKVYETLSGDDDGRVCKGIPEEACAEQPGNFLRHVLSLAATKTGDGLADPKLVLAWLLGALGAPAFMIGLLVPIREAGSLLPQLAIAAGIRSLPRRKWAWAVGSVVQGLAVAGIALSALLLSGNVAGGTILALLTIFAVARSVCSVSYKDVLGKTVSKATRGTATGSASTIAAAAVMLFGMLLSFTVFPISIDVVAAALIVASLLWIAAAVLFTTLAEAPGATGGGGNPLAVARQHMSLLKTDRQLRLFIATRALLIGTALAPPFMLSMAGRTSDRALGELGLFVIAASFASVSSTYLWGRLSDVSSRRTLTISAIIAGLTLGAAGVLGLIDGGLLQYDFLLPGLLFVLMLAYQGVRLGRSTHLVDMADEDKRAAYTALSNTIIGVVLLAGSVFGAIAELAGEAVVLVLFACSSVAAAVTALGLEEVQQDEI